jgi:hypothetical protein
MQEMLKSIAEWALKHGVLFKPVNVVFGALSLTLNASAQTWSPTYGDATETQITDFFFSARYSSNFGSVANLKAASVHKDAPRLEVKARMTNTSKYVH